MSLSTDAEGGAHLSPPTTSSTTSSQLTKSQPANLFEVGLVSRNQRVLALDSGCGDESVGETYAGLASNATGTFGNIASNTNFPERSEQRCDECGGGVAGEEFCSGHNRIMHSMVANLQFGRAAQVVDENVGVYKKVSHGPIRHGLAPLHPWPRQRLSPTPVWGPAVGP